MNQHQAKVIEFNRPVKKGDKVRAGKDSEFVYWVTEIVMEHCLVGHLVGDLSGNARIITPSYKIGPPYLADVRHEDGTRIR